MTAIRTAGLTKDYGAGRGVFDLELQVSAGEAFGLFGEEGSGKSTLIGLLMGMLRPTRGSGYVFGLECFGDAAQVKRRVGWVPDGTPEFGSLQGGEVVAYLAAMRGGVDRDRVRELARRLDLDLGRPHSEYRPADRQKLSIVVAFMHEPDLLLLDEPSQDLDEDAAAALDALVDEARSTDATVLLASRSATALARHCRVVGTLRKGKLSRPTGAQHLLDEQQRKALPP